MEKSKALKTIRVRIRDRHSTLLSQWSRSVNFVWNYVNELSSRSIRDHGRFLSAFDIHKYTNGSSADLDLHSQTIQGIADQYVIRRKQFRKCRLHWRSSSGSRRSLGWIPFKAGNATWDGAYVVFRKCRFRVWDSYGLDKYKFRSGSFNEDSRGNWYFNAVVEIDTALSAGIQAVGIDLGLKSIATCSDGATLENGRFYLGLQDALASAQRAGKKLRAKAIHAKIANRRKDALHKFSRQLVDRCGLIVVGNVSSKNLSRTRMAKSVNDAGWGILKTMLSYKCDHAGIVFEVVDEAYTTQTCSDCGALPDSRPKGIAGLGIREWTCSECGAAHDRDVNAARNILALGHGRPVVGIGCP